MPPLLFKLRGAVGTAGGFNGDNAGAVRTVLGGGCGGDRLLFLFRSAAELIDAFNKADADDNIRAIIVTGAGRGFCAGADL